LEVAGDVGEDQDGLLPQEGEPHLGAFRHAGAEGGVGEPLQEGLAQGGDLLLLEPGPAREASDQGLEPWVLQEGQEGEAEAHELAGGEVLPQGEAELGHPEEEGVADAPGEVQAPGQGVAPGGEPHEVVRLAPPEGLEGLGLQIGPGPEAPGPEEAGEVQGGLLRQVPGEEEKPPLSKPPRPLRPPGPEGLLGEPEGLLVQVRHLAQGEARRAHLKAQKLAEEVDPRRVRPCGGARHGEDPPGLFP